MGPILIGGTQEMESERENFKILLSYWVEHSREHVGEFKEMAEKAKELGEIAIHKAILEGIEQVNKANEAFEAALRILKRGNS